MLSTLNPSTGYSMKQLFNRSPICSSIFHVVIQSHATFPLQKDQTTQHKTVGIFIPQDERVVEQSTA